MATKVAKVGIKKESGWLYYLDKKGNLTQGFAAIARPAKYGNSGIMTFLVNQQGLVFQKDLGADTEAAVAAIKAYDPDDSWHPTGD